MNASKFDRLTFEGLAKYPNHTIDFFLEKFDFSDVDEFADNLGRIYSSKEKGIAIVNAMRKKEKKARRRGMNKSKKAKKAAKSKNINANALQEQETVLECEINTDETISETNLEEITIPVQDVPKSISLKEKLEGYMKDYEELGKSIARNEKNQVTLTKSLNRAVEKVKQLEDSLEYSKKKVSELQSQLHDAETKIRDERQMMEMLSDEIADLEEQIRLNEITRVFFCTPDKPSEHDIIASEVKVDDDMFSAKLMTVVSDSRLGQIQLPIGLINELTRYLAVIEIVNQDTALKDLVLVFSEDDVLVDAIKVFCDGIKIESN